MEIDLQSAIASQRSRPSKSHSTNPSGGPHVERVDDKEDGSHNVIVAPASAAMSAESSVERTDASGSEWSETESGVTSRARSDPGVERRGPLSRGQSFGAGTMPGVQEERESVDRYDR